MGRYFIRRVLQFIPVFLGATFLIYALVFALPGDPIRALGGDKPLADSVVEALNERYNLNDPLMIQYGKYIGVLPDGDKGFDGILQGDLGEDFRGRQVSDLIKQRLPVTARLATVAFIVEIILGLIAGILAGLKKGGFLDNLVLVSTVAVISIPSLVTGFLAQIVFGVELQWLPVAGIQRGWISYVMPGIVLASLSLAYIARLTRTSLVENLRTDYVRTATAKGLTRGRVVGIHTLRNSMIPVVTFLAVDLGGLMGGAIITETIFNLPGLGRAVFQAIFAQEGTTVVGIVSFLVFVYMTANLVVDFAYAALDPRIRYE